MAAAVLGTAAPASASDFSPLGDPAFSRGMFLSMKERRMVRCVGQWSGSAQGETLFPLVEEITRRIGIRLGDHRRAELELTFEPPEMIDVLDIPKDVRPPTLPKELLNEMAEEADAPVPRPLPEECVLLADRYQSGGLEAAASVLGPAPTAPVPLPPAGSCLAMMKSTEAISAGEIALILDAIRSASDDIFDPLLKTQILNDYNRFDDSAVFSLGDPPFHLRKQKGEWPDVLQLPCIGSIVEVKRSVSPEDMDDSGRAERAYGLFEDIDRLLEDLDARVAADPSIAADPVRREALGLFWITSTPTP